MDKSAGYEMIASKFIQVRGAAPNGIGTSSVRTWARTLRTGSSILDIGCGTGFPISGVLIEEGMTVYGMDASPTLVRAFRQHFPNATIVCEAVEDSSFFNREFDGIIAWGLLFLLPKETQINVIHQMARALKSGGKLLFTAPSQETDWKDVMTDQQSVSLGARVYKEVLLSAGLSLIAEFEDEGGNYYYSAIKKD